MVQEWVQDYYNETDRPKRKEILEKAIAEEGMTPENELRKYLYDARYGDSEEAGREVDYFIRGWMTLEYMKYLAVLGREGVRRITRDRPAAVQAESETAPDEKAAS